MKSSILIASYLWKDTWKRWFEQPSSPLARFSVTALLVLVAATILVAFQLAERSLRDRLERFGLNTLVIRETVPPDSRRLFLTGEAPDRFALLSHFGKKIRLRQLFVRAQTEWQNSVLVMSYPPSSLASLAEVLGPDTPLVCVSEGLPEGALMRVTLDQKPALARVRHPRAWLRSLVTEDILLAPQGMFAPEERLGYIDTTIYQRGADAPSVARTLAAIQALSSLENRPPPQIQSALPLVRELEALKDRQAQWRNALAAILGLALALVYGAIGFLEFRQNLYVSALLRSFGASRPLLYGRYWMESMLLANGAAAVAIFVLAMVHSILFSTLGFPAAMLDLSQANPYLGVEILSIFLWVNIGAWLSTIPIALGLRQPVGTTLS